ncbi:MAG: hypothetical protein AVDCRST_MAG19-771 [uncultured Thermomicrobiales bacterium]|uniref:Uncharacterized protein n=1 Tax=uncultured Thermomicrobiales bacterium TaxID=1645740 RepID=A0A6J4UIL6_9BACT|nr:MAG: hypothetical protein AVDCRST_MAG19-771 [uncultured Thermomicrobiales bacterium]
MEEMGPPEGTPTDDMAGMEMGTPEAAGVAETTDAAATPASTATPAGTPADQAKADEAVVAAENLLDCLNGRNAEGFVALPAPNFLLAASGSANPRDAVAGFAEIPPIVVCSVDNGDGRVSVDAVHGGFLAFGPAQVNQSRLFFVEEGGYGLLDAAESLLESLLWKGPMPESTSGWSTTPLR